MRFIREATDYSFVTCAGNECLLWESPAQLQQNKVQEVLEPAKILDIESSNQITSISGYKVMQGAFLVLAQCERTAYIFMAKVKSKSKVKKPDSQVSLTEKSHEILSSKIIDDRRVQIGYGNVF